MEQILIIALVVKVCALGLLLFFCKNSKYRRDLVYSTAFIVPSIAMLYNNKLEAFLLSYGLSMMFVMRFLFRSMNIDRRGG